MPLPIIANTIRTAVEGVTSRGSRWVNVHHFKYVGGLPSHAQLDTLAASIDKLYGAGAPYAGGLQWINSCHTTVQALNVRFTPLDGVTPTYVKAISAAGASGGVATPGEVCACVTLRTGTRGRRYRGRVYLPGPSATNLNADGQFAAGIVSGLPINWTGFAADIAGQAPAWTHVVASYKFSLATAVTSVECNASADVQRRRKD